MISVVALEFSCPDRSGSAESSVRYSFDFVVSLDIFNFLNLSLFPVWKFICSGCGESIV